jgi:hypothetical protein
VLQSETLIRLIAADKNKSSELWASMKLNRTAVGAEVVTRQWRCHLQKQVCGGSRGDLLSSRHLLFCGCREQDSALPRADIEEDDQGS